MLVLEHFNAQQNPNDSIFDIDSLLGDDESTPPPFPIPASPQEVTSQPKDTSALGGYNVLIADRGNNRIIEVTPDKQIVWKYDFKGLRPGFGADDAFFADVYNTGVYQKIIDGLLTVRAGNPSFEPEKYGSTKGQNEAFASVCPTLLRMLNDVRTCMYGE